MNIPSVCPAVFSFRYLCRCTLCALTSPGIVYFSTVLITHQGWLPIFQRIPGLLSCPRLLLISSLSHGTLREVIRD